MSLTRLERIDSIRTDILLGGINSSFVVQTSENELFVVKPHNPRNDLWQSPNEVLAGLLGRTIDGPFLEPHLVYLDEELLEASGMGQTKNFILDTLQPGIGFSTKYFEGILQGTIPESDVQQLVNPEAAIPILILDTWLYNIDRNNPGNLIFVPLDSKARVKPRKMYGIDQGLAFGGAAWSDEQLQQEKSKLIVENRLPILDRLARRHSKNYLRTYLDKAEAITKDDLREMMSELPSEWAISESDRETIVEYLRVRQLLLRPLFESSFEV